METIKLQVRQGKLGNGMVIEKMKTGERRKRTVELIKHLLKERNQLLSLLIQASGAGTTDAPEHDRDVILEFCQVLVDYIAAAHFGLYERIIEGRERRKAVADLAVKVFPRIEQTTEIALAFDEKYNPEKVDIDPASFHLDLSRLGEELATRIELEDQLIALLQSRRP